MRCYITEKQNLPIIKHRKNDSSKDECVFCEDGSQDRMIEGNETMFVIPNRVFYDMFEGRRVEDHVMVIPKAHREGYREFTEKERSDAMALIADYEERGYNVYARGVGSPSRSVKHQHTHLIKLIDKPSKVIIFSKKPYVLIDF